MGESRYESQAPKHSLSLPDTCPSLKRMSAWWLHVVLSQTLCMLTLLQLCVLQTPCACVKFHMNLCSVTSKALGDHAEHCTASAPYDTLLIPTRSIGNEQVNHVIFLFKLKVWKITNLCEVHPYMFDTGLDPSYLFSILQPRELHIILCPQSDSNN